MPDTAAGFVDAAFLEKEGAKVLGVKQRDRETDAGAVVAWLRKSYSRHSYEMSEQYAWRGSQAPAWGGSKLLRAYWYDGAYAPNHRKAVMQRRYFEAIARAPGVQFRLGHVAEGKPRFKKPIRRAVANAAEELGLDPTELLAEFDKRWEFRPVRQQKGVDTLIALDLVRLAGRGVIDTAVLVSGDRDFAEAIRLRSRRDHRCDTRQKTTTRPSQPHQTTHTTRYVLDRRAYQLMALQLPAAPPQHRPQPPTPPRPTRPRNHVHNHYQTLIMRRNRWNPTN